MPHRNHFRERRTKLAGTGAYTDVEFGPILEDRLYIIRRFAVEDETSAPATDIRVFVSGHGYNHLLNEQNSPAAATLYWDVDKTYLRQGESLVARFTGPTASDVLQLYVEGVWMEIAELEASP